MSGGGGGTSGSNTTEPWGHTKEQWIDVLNQGASLYSTPYIQNPYMQVANPSDGTQLYETMATQRASLGAPDLNAARGFSQDLSNGAYMGQSPGSNANVQSARNAYAGQNSYLDQMIANNAEDMTTGFQNGTAAQNDALAAMGGAFGGTGWQQKQTADAGALAKQIGNMATQNRFQDYTTQQGLSEAAINRDTANDQWNLTQQQNAYGGDMAARLQGGQLAGSLAQDDWAGINAARQMGLDQNAYQQTLLDKQSQNWSQQMAYPYQQLSGMAELLSRASGYGSSSVTSNPYQTSNLATGAGLLGMGAGLYGALK